VETVDPADNGRACSSNAHSQGNAPDPHPCRDGDIRSASMSLG
jgi:hypothetical protein